MSVLDVRSILVCPLTVHYNKKARQGCMLLENLPAARMKRLCTDSNLRVKLHKTKRKPAESPAINIANTLECSATGCALPTCHWLRYMCSDVPLAISRRFSPIWMDTFTAASHRSGLASESAVAPLAAPRRPTTQFNKQRPMLTVAPRAPTTKRATTPQRGGGGPKKQFLGRSTSLSTPRLGDRRSVVLSRLG